MRQPFRGSSERSIRFFALLAAFSSAPLAVAACSAGAPTGQYDATLTSAPPGCQETMCDYFYTSCIDPCAECWNICGRQDDEASVLRCADTCKQICAPSESPTPASKCGEDLIVCRSTLRNTICVDHLRDDTAEGMADCSPEMSAANCSCGADAACLGALDRLNTKCRKCNAAWVMPCLEAACKKETDEMLACLHAGGCSVLTSCEACQTGVLALSTCFENAQRDPSDVGGCYSKPRACSGEPLCPYALY